MTGLPSDGTVYLADGATPVVNGETLTTTQLTGLTFKPTANLFGQSSTFTYSVTDAANNTANGSATLAIQNQSNPGQPTTVTMSPSGLHGATLSGGGIDTLQIQGAGTADLSGVSAFPKIVLDPNGNAVTLGTGNFAGVGTILVVAPGPGSTVDASADRSGKTLLFSATGNGQRFVGGFETVGVYVAAMSVGSDTLQGGSGTNFLNLAGGGNADLSNATGFEFVILDPNGNSVTLASATLNNVSTMFIVSSGGSDSVDASRNNGTGKAVVFEAGASGSSFAGGAETDEIFTAASAVGTDSFRAGSGPSYLNLTGSGTSSLAGATGFEYISLFGSAETLMGTDDTLAGPSLTWVFNNGNGNSIELSGDTVASATRSVVVTPGSGSFDFSGGFESDEIFVAATAVGNDVLKGGSNTNYPQPDGIWGSRPVACQRFRLHQHIWNGSGVNAY